MQRKDVSGCWRIEARAFLIIGTPFTHNFWALLDAASEAVVDQIHGLAVNPLTGETKAIGNSSHCLLVVTDPTIRWSLQPGQPTAVAAAGPEADIMPIWQCALNAIPAINALAVPYPDLWQHMHKPNSNSVFTTIGKIMGFPDPAGLLPTIAPGISLVLSQEIIDRYCYNPAHPPRNLYS